MELKARCAVLKAKLAAELSEVPREQERGELLLAGLYEMSRTVLTELGPPLHTTEYAEKQAAVLELVSFIAIPMIRSASRDTRGVAVLTEIAEGCPDPLLKKKLKVYAQQLLAACSRPSERSSFRVGRVAAVGSFLLVALLAGLVIRSGELPNVPERREALAVPRPAALPAPAQAQAPLPPTSTGGAPSITLKLTKPPAEAAPGSLGEHGQVRGDAQFTRVQVINNQILVPVLIRHGAESIRVELVLDTGATRSSIHEGVAGKLKIDLKSARATQAEVADGRLVHAWAAPVDSLSVGPFTMTGPELDVLPYRGSQGLHDGLLGMDFLAKHPYQVDMERELIRWN
ncbi:hypothetical protein GMLC_10080 [Geomonas limicola]|uniref:Peptidase n=1 Tax=Geomonas limicola TaxID=2740186 RepID=A0A6V8N7Z2_9BACT|nr:retropepsin-like aspartic protease [Geomonas limicola]GFO67429.1 hypothetical protein GMLC_10080 [Geomonas limicola]